MQAPTTGAADAATGAWVPPPSCDRCCDTEQEVCEQRKPGYQPMPNADPGSPASSSSDASAQSGSVSGNISRLRSRDPLAFSSTRMEAAFCAYLGRASSVSAQVLRGLQLAAWLVALGKWIYHSAIGHPDSSQTPFEWAAGGGIVLLVVIAELTSLQQLRREHRFVRHEMLKAQNSLIMMVLKMFATGMFIRKHDFSTPQVRVIIGGGSLVFDRIRVSQTLPLQVFNLLTFVIMEVSNWTAGASSREVAKEVVVTALFGIVVPVVALGLLEGRARMRFLSLHSHLDDPQALLPTPWARLDAALHWADPAAAAAAAPGSGNDAAPAAAMAAAVPGPRTPPRLGHRRGEGPRLAAASPAASSVFAGGAHSHEL